LVIYQESKSSVAVACFFPHRDKDLSAPLYRRMNLKGMISDVLKMIIFSLSYFCGIISGKKYILFFLDIFR